MYLLDTDTLNYVLKKINPTVTRFRSEASHGAEFALSPVVTYEVTRYLRLKRASRLLTEYDRLVANWRPVVLEAADWDRAPDLWALRHGRGLAIADTDLLIAVSALKVGATLVTNNTRHFQGLGLTLENWTTS